MCQSVFEAGTSAGTCSVSARRGSRRCLGFFIHALLFAFAVAVTPDARAFYEMGRGELFLHTRGTVTYDSNVFALEDPEDDVLFSLNPELEYVRRAGRGDISLLAGVTVGRFLEFSELNFEDYYSVGRLGYPVAPGSRFGGGIELSYRQTTGVDDFLNERTETETYMARVTNRYRLNERIGLRNSLLYSRSDRQRRGFSRVSRISGTFGVAYLYSENLDFETTYRIRRSRTTGRTDRGTRETLDHAVTVGANGDLTEKVSGSVSVGLLNTRTITGAGRERFRVIFGTGLSWAARANTEITLDADRDQDLSADDRTVERTSVELGLNHRFTPKMSGRVFTGYRLSEYRGIESDTDETYRAGAGLSYEFTTRWTGSLDYAFAHTDSERRDTTFERHTVSLSTRYTF